MRRTFPRSLWWCGLLLVVAGTDSFAQEPERASAVVQKVHAASATAEPDIRMPQKMGEPVEPDLPMGPIDGRASAGRLAAGGTAEATRAAGTLAARNLRLEAAMRAILGRGAVPVLVFRPQDVRRVAANDPTRVGVRPARVTPKPLVSGVQAAKVGTAAAGGRIGAIDDPVESLDLPPEMPAVHLPDFVAGSCTGMQPGQSLYEAKRSWALAHHHVWRAYQLLEFIGESPGQFRDDYWEDGYRSADGNENWSPRNWFGPYASHRAGAIREVVGKLWDRFRSGEFNGIEIRVKCPTPANEADNPGNICFTWEPPAHHVVKGYVNLCEGFFDESEAYRALLLAHEMLHHATVSWKENGISKSYFLGDTHTHADGNTCATGLKAEKMYGANRTMHLAATGECWHRNIAMRNNDNYGWFIMRLGEAVRNGDLASFPTEGVPWQSPGATGNECSEIDVPPPGEDIQDPEACQKIGQEMVCPGGGGGGGGVVLPSTCLAQPHGQTP